MGNMTSEKRLKDVALFNLESNEIHDNNLQICKR